MFHVKRLDRLATYEALLRQWQKAVNLVAPSTLDAIWHRHFADFGPAPVPGPARPDLGRSRLRRRLSRPGGGNPAGGTSPPLVPPLLGRDGRGGQTPAASPHPTPPRKGERSPRVTRITLIESNARKCAFLREVVRQTGIGASLWISCRQESKRRRLKLVLHAPDVVSARALAPLDRLLGLAAPLIHACARLAYS